MFAGGLAATSSEVWPALPQPDQPHVAQPLQQRSGWCDCDSLRYCVHSPHLQWPAMGPLQR